MHIQFYFNNIQSYLYWSKYDDLMITTRLIYNVDTIKMLHTRKLLAGPINKLIIVYNIIKYCLNIILRSNHRYDDTYYLLKYSNIL